MKVKGFLNKKRVVAVIILFVVIAVMVFSNPEVQKFILRPDTVKLNLQTGINYSLQVAGKEMLLVSSDGIRAVDDDGRENWSIVAPTTAPVVMTKNDYIMLADINGTTVNVYEYILFTFLMSVFGICLWEKRMYAGSAGILGDD